MKISVFGLGYVGCVSAACLAHDGHQVIGVDINPLKVAMLKEGKSPIIEPGLDELVAEVVENERLKVSTDSETAVYTTEVSIVCVGTPSNGNGSLNLDYVKNVCMEIGKAMHTKPAYHMVVVRSTVLPGTVREILIPILEESSGKQAGVDFGVVMNPEFLRESTAIKDYYNPSLVVIGELDQQSGKIVDQIYQNIDAQFVHVTLETAEMVKYVNNAFHALKVIFANEIGNLAKAQGVDGRDVMEIVCMDNRLNISPAYLKPGYAFGGSCLPKDVRALLYRAKEKDLQPHLLNALLPSNEAQIQNAIKMVEQTGKKKVGVLGLSFKAGTDDVRESPMIPLIETLVGRGYQVKVFDEKVEVANLIGANRAYLEKEIPHITSLMNSSISDIVNEVDTIVIGNNNPSFYAVPSMMREDQVLIDLIGIDKHNSEIRGDYEGICW